MSIGSVGSSTYQGWSLYPKTKLSSSAKAGDEQGGGIAKLFAKGDSDGDGKLSATEFSALAPKGPDGAAMAPPPGAPDSAEMFSSLDSDGDGSLTQTEFESGMKGMQDALAEAVKKFKSGDSESLVDLIFGSAESDTAQGSTTSGTSSIDSAAIADDSSEESSASDASSRTDAQRFKQWMLDAFASQFKVSQAMARAA